MTGISGFVKTRGAFLLTRPSRDVTFLDSDWNMVPLFLLTRPSRDVTRVLSAELERENISTHTPLAGRDR